MSELKYQLMLNKDMSWVPCYLKSDVDKQIKELEENHKKEIGQLLMAIVELTKACKDKDDWCLHTHKENRHHKFKRCLAKAEACMH